MTGIRPLRASDMPQVVPLLTRAFGYSATSRRADLVASFTRIFKDHPWSDPDTPSLVWEGPGGRILGFIGAATRRMALDGTSVRLTCSSSLVADPDAGVPGIGAFLLKRMLDGPQDVTITDSARDATSAMWFRLGGFVLPIGSLAWARPLRPVRLGLALLRHRLGGVPTTSLRPAAPARGWTPPLAITGLRVASPGLRSEPLDADAMLDQLPRMVDGARLVPDYDRAFLDFMFCELDQVRSRGRAVRRLVRDADGAVLGWYVAMHHQVGIWQVVQMIAPASGAAQVMRQLLHEAQQAGAVAVYGRADARTIVADAFDNRTMLVPYTRYLVHTGDERISTAIRAGDAVLTGLEGDTWMHR